MDSKDFRLLVLLHQDARQSFQSLGSKVSLSAPAVRDRLRRLEERGILRGFWLTPDPALLDREDLLVLFNGDWGHDHAEKLLKVKDVAWVTLKMDGGLTVQLWPHDPDEALKTLAEALGANPYRQTLSERSEFRQKPSLMDWQIIDELFKEPRISLNDLCEKTGLSPKTVRKHLEMITQDHFVYITPKLGPLSDSGELVYPLVVFGEVSMSELSGVIGDAFLLNATQKPPSKYLICRSESGLADVTTKISMIKKLANVDSVNVTLNREQLTATEFIHSLILDEIEKLSRK